LSLQVNFEDQLAESNEELLKNEEDDAVDAVSNDVEDGKNDYEIKVESLVLELEQAQETLEERLFLLLYIFQQIQFINRIILIQNGSAVICVCFESRLICEHENTYQNMNAKTNLQIVHRKYWNRTVKCLRLLIKLYDQEFVC